MTEREPRRWNFTNRHAKQIQHPRHVEGLPPVVDAEVTLPRSADCGGSWPLVCSRPSRLGRWVDLVEPCLHLLHFLLLCSPTTAEPAQNDFKGKHRSAVVHGNHLKAQAFSVNGSRRCRRSGFGRRQSSMVVPILIDLTLES